jgi:hypothetical protein
MYTNKIQSNNRQCYYAICNKTDSSRLKEACFFFVLIDSSNQLNEKLVPLIIRYFHTEKVMMVMLLELVNLSDETSDLLLMC